MRIVIIGLGSMGKRRMRLLHEIAVKKQLDIELIGIDGREDRRKEAEDQATELGFTIVTYPRLGIVSDKLKIDAAVVSTSPLSHAAVIRECLEYGLNVFTELNLVTDGYDENMKLAKEKRLILFLSSTPIFREEIRYITSVVKDSTIKLNYVYHVGQYLPDWHPWEGYKDFFVGDKRTNGCREILAVELPWMVKAFGGIESIRVVADKKTNLDIDFNDCYNILIRHKTGHTGVFLVDVVSRPPVHSLKIVGEKFGITWDGLPQGLCEYSEKDKAFRPVNLYDHVEHREGYNPTIVENAYVTELLAFLSALNGEKDVEYSFEEDREVLAIIDKIEAV